MTRRDELDHQMRDLLIQLALISSGTTSGSFVGGGIGAGAEDSGPSTGDAYPPHVRFADEYDQCETDDQRERTVGRAREHLKALRGTTGRERPAGETREQEDKRILREGRGWDINAVATHFRRPPSEILRLRLAAGFGPDGKELPPDPTNEQLRARARQLRGQRLSVRQIALALGKPRSTIHDWLSS